MTDGARRGRGATGPDALDAFMELVVAHLRAPEQVELELRKSLATAGLTLATPYPRNHGRLLEQFKAGVISELSARDDVATVLATLEAMDFAAEVLQTTLSKQRVRIRAKRTYPAKAAHELGQLLRQGLAPEDAFRALGIARSTGYRLLKRRANAG